MKKSEVQSRLHSVREQRKLVSRRYTALAKQLGRLKDEEEQLEAQLKKLEENDSGTT